jgi:hypothetical protein
MGKKKNKNDVDVSAKVDLPKVAKLDLPKVAKLDLPKVAKLDLPEEEEELLVLDKAKLIVDYNGTIYRDDVKKVIGVNCVVRISLYLTDEFQGCYPHDAPYVCVCEEDKKKKLFCGIVQDIGRTGPSNKYLARTGERIWFSADNVIEIPSNHQTDVPKSALTKYLNNKGEKVPITGPLYTIEYDPCSGSESDDSYEDYESSE